MEQLHDNGEFEVRPLPIIGPYNVQRFKQFSPEDSANWVIYKGQDTKRPYSMFPAMGRAHINYTGFNQLIFGHEPRATFKTIKYYYVVEGNAIYRVDDQWNTINIAFDQNGMPLATLSGPVYFSFLVVNAIVFACFVDTEFIYVYQEDTETFYRVTDDNAPGNITVNGKIAKPGYIITFGNRIAVSIANSAQFFLSELNLLTANEDPSIGAQFEPDYAFSVGALLNGTVEVDAGESVFAQENGIIRQMGVLNNTAYLFTDYTTGIWSNIPAIFTGTGVTFPWKKNTTYDWNFGIANPTSLDINFGILVFLAQNSDGLLQFMMSNGGQPEKISDDAVDVLLQRYTNQFGSNNPFLSSKSNGFLYQYENNIYYRMSGGEYVDYQILDQEQDANSVEYNFEVSKWHRCIELNGNRNRIQQHVYFNSKHLVTVADESVIYEMSGKYYYNEVRNILQADVQQPDAFIAYPFRYERITSIVSLPDYAEFETEYVEIDFVFGDSNITYSPEPFSNTKFIIGEEAATDGSPKYMVSEELGTDGNPVFIIADGTNTPSLTDNTYNYLLNPHVELFFSDDGGVSFHSADVRIFSQMGQYVWKMRWYQLGPSRNRVYKLIAVSFVPIVILGGVMNVRRVSGGSN